MSMGTSQTSLLIRLLWKEKSGRPANIIIKAQKFSGTSHEEEIRQASSQRMPLILVGSDKDPCVWIGSK